LKSVQAGIVKIKPTTTSVQHDIPPLKQLRPLEENVPRNTLLLRFGRAVLDAAPEPKEGWFAPEAGHEDLARCGSLDVAVAFIARRLGA
jgi:hypothetical protein